MSNRSILFLALEKGFLFCTATVEADLCNRAKLLFLDLIWEVERLAEKDERVE